MTRLIDPEPFIEYQPCGAPISQEFGDLSPTGHGHLGRDYACPTGTPIVNGAAGVSVPFTNSLTNWNGAEVRSFGNAVCIDYQNGLYGLYAHLSVIHVPIGAVVDAGVVVGLSGNTGVSTGPHCHFQISDSPTFPLDPSRSRDPRLFFTLEDTMEKYRLSLMQIAGGDYERMNMSYAKLLNSGFALPAQLDDDLNGAVVRRFAMIELAASARAQDAYVALGGAL